MSEITKIIDGRAFLEGPRWRGDTLYASDMHGGEVIAIDADGQTTVVAEVPNAPSGLGWLPDGRMLIVSMHDRKLLRREHDGRLVEHADLSKLAPYDINDMTADTRGHAYVGQFGYDLHAGGTPATSALLHVGPDGAVDAAAPDMRMANGMAVLTDDRTLVVAESAGRCIIAFRIGDDGALHDRRLWVELPAVPDGICIDAEHAVWIAGPVSDSFVRVEANADGSGRTTHEIKAPNGHHAIACALGGTNGRTLFMLTSPTLGHPEQSRAARAAAIYATEVDTPGCERP